MECNKDLVKVFEEMHKLKLENEKLDKENKNLKIALDKKAKEFFEAEDNCIYSYISSDMLGSTVLYRIFNPTADVDANIRALLKDGGIEIMRSCFDGGNSTSRVKVDGIEYYSNPYCEEAREILEKLQNKEVSLRAEVASLAKEAEWLEEKVVKNGGQKRRWGMLGFKPYFRK